MCELQVYSALHLSAAEQTTAAVETASTTALTEEPSDKRVRSSAEFDFPLGMEVNSETFTGMVYLNPIIRQDNPDGLSATNRVTFAPGVHNSGWHTHGAMMVIGTGGIGYYQEEGLPTQIIRPGDVIEIPEGVKHWHGAAPDSWFSQIVIWDAAYSRLPYCCKAKISKSPPLPAGTFFQLLIGIEYHIQDMLSLISIKNKKMYLTAD